MSVVRQQPRAGLLGGSPLLLLVGMLFLGNDLPSAETKAPKTTGLISFQEFQSSCIDLGHYEERTRKLTVRFVGRKPGRFYRYSNVPAEIWRKLNALNETGSVGEYLNETIVQDPKRYPYEELSIHKFKTIPRKKKPEK